MKKTTRESEKMFGVSTKQLDEWEAACTRGELPGRSVSEVIVGRPLRFGEPLRPIGFKEPESKIAAIDRRAERLGMKRSDYLRYLVDKDLDLAGIA
ncbi:MAG: hypothetical protein LBK67_09135 [Coriobacteriales bacterium]|jgi:hypothetical protein|nr:hypothetical protein [Coriobacteriales bacterium]